MRRVRLTHWRGRRKYASGSARFLAVRRRSVGRGAMIVAAMFATTLALSAPSAFGATKSPREFVPGGAHELIWSSTSAVGGANGTIVVRNLTVIAEVRALINALPLTNNLHHACPDDMMLPITISFAASPGSAPFTRVIFQLGGCPSAEVVQRGSIVLPTLGGPNLSSTYGKIKKLIG